MRKHFAGWAEVARVVVLDNLREGVLTPDIYDPTLNPLFKDVLAHYGVVAMPCRIQDPDRKGKVESGVGHAQKTPLKGLRFESLEEAQAYLDHWEAALGRYAHSRHDQTASGGDVCRRKTVACFRCRSNRSATTNTANASVHLDGCVEVEAAYYSLPPGWIGKLVKVQWDGLHVRILDPETHQLLREHVRQKRGRHRIQPEDNPKKTPFSTTQLLARAARAGSHIGAFCEAIHRHQGEPGIRRILGVLSLAKKFGVSAVEDACAAALELGVHEYRFVRRYLERRPQLTLASSRSSDPRTDPVSRSHQPQNPGARTMNLIELQRALRQLRLGGIAAVLETRLASGSGRTHGADRSDLLSGFR